MIFLQELPEYTTLLGFDMQFSLFLMFRVSKDNFETSKSLLNCFLSLNLERCKFLRKALG